jgi:hypothetical protein
MVMPRRRLRGRGPLIVLLMGVLAWAVVVFYKRYEMASIHNQLEQEFAKIQLLPGSLLIKHESTYGTETSLVQSSYKTPLTFSKVKVHYASGLVKNGWVVGDEHFLPHAGAWSNVDEILFCKEPFRASLGYSDGVPQSSYWFNVSWGLSGCKYE